MMYAILLKLDTETLKNLYPNDNWQNAYNEITETLTTLGFHQQQSELYFGNPNISVVQCVLATQKLSHSYAWFKPALLEMKMLRIAEVDDLAIAI